MSSPATTFAEPRKLAETSEPVQSAHFRQPSDSSLWFIREKFPAITQRRDRDTVEWQRSQYAVVVPRRRKMTRQDTFISLQKWQGIVLSTSAESFLARVIDLKGKNPDEEVELPLEEISRADLPLIKPGAIFYWNIGYKDSVNGQRIRASLIRFRRSPEWTEEELARAESEAEELRYQLGWTNSADRPSREQ